MSERHSLIDPIVTRRDRGADVEMRWYADHTHGLTETPRGEGDGLVHIVKFFDKALSRDKA